MRTKIVLGELEQAVMEVIWRQSATTVRAVVDSLNKPSALHRTGRQLAYTTIMTVMNRLVSQAILIRQINPQGVFLYRPRYDRDEFSSRASRQAIEELVRRYGQVAMAQFLERLDHVPPKEIAELRRRLSASRLK